MNDDNFDSHGNIARRLRKLDMTTDVGSVRGVYTTHKPIIKDQEQLNDIEYSQLDGRLIDEFVIRQRNGDAIIQIYWSDWQKQSDVIMLIHLADTTHRVFLSNSYAITGYESSEGAIFLADSTRLYPHNQLIAEYDNWMSNLRTAQGLTVLFQLMDKLKFYTVTHDLLTQVIFKAKQVNKGK